MYDYLREIPSSFREEYNNLDWFNIAKKMRQPAWVFDSRSITNPIKISNSGIKLWRIGDGSIKNN